MAFSQSQLRFFSASACWKPRKYGKVPGSRFPRSKNTRFGYSRPTTQHNRLLAYTAIRHWTQVTVTASLCTNHVPLLYGTQGNSLWLQYEGYAKRKPNVLQNPVDVEFFLIFTQKSVKMRNLVKATDTASRVQQILLLLIVSNFSNSLVFWMLFSHFRAQFETPCLETLAGCAELHFWPVARKNGRKIKEETL